MTDEDKEFWAARGMVPSLRYDENCRLVVTPQPPEQTFKINAMWGEYDLFGRWQHDPLLPMTADEQRADNLARGWPCP